MDVKNKITLGLPSVHRSIKARRFFLEPPQTEPHDFICHSLKIAPYGILDLQFPPSKGHPTTVEDPTLPPGQYFTVEYDHRQHVVVPTSGKLHIFNR
jgi:hypothetical protein